MRAELETLRVRVIYANVCVCVIDAMCGMASQNACARAIPLGLKPAHNKKCVSELELALNT